jgi:hypothetical protein
VLAIVNAWFRRGRWFDEEVCDSWLIIHFNSSSL